MGDEGDRGHRHRARGGADRGDAHHVAGPLARRRVLLRGGAYSGIDPSLRESEPRPGLAFSRSEAGGGRLCAASARKNSPK